MCQKTALQPLLVAECLGFFFLSFVLQMLLPGVEIEAQDPQGHKWLVLTKCSVFTHFKA